MNKETHNNFENNTLKAPHASLSPVHNLALSEGLQNALADSAGLPDDNSQKKFVSVGQHAHKWGSYLSVDWVFNAITGVSFAYWGKFTDSGKKLWSGWIEEGFSKALKPVIKNPETLKKAVGRGSLFMSIIAGGMFTIPPLMFLESKKVRKNITQGVDSVVYGKEAVQNDPKLLASYEAMDNEPKKDAVNGIISRYVALAPLLAMVLYKPTDEASTKIYFRHIKKFSEKTANKMGFTIQKLFSKLPAEQAENHWDYIHKAVAMDFGLGIPYAVLHSVFYNMFVKISHANKEKKEDELVAQPSAPNAAPTTETAAPASDNTAIPAASNAGSKFYTATHKPAGKISAPRSELFTDKTAASSGMSLGVS